MGLITFINVAIGVSLGGLLYTIWPEHYFSWYPSIPFFYWVMAMAMTFFLDRVKRKIGDVTVTMYMLVRLCTFTHTGEDGESVVFLCDVVDQFHDQYRFAHSGSSEKSDLTSFGVRFQ